MQRRTNYKKSFASKKKLVERLLNVRSLIVLISVVLIAILIVRLALHKAVFGESVANIFRSKRALSSEVVALQTTLQKYAADQSLLTTLRAENDTLKAELNRPDRTHGTLATVLFPPGRSIYDTFVIDAGTDAGINVGARVFAFDSVALGTVTDVSPNRATVQLYSAQGHETPAFASGSNIALTLTGRGSGEYEIHMPRDVHFDQGQSIVLQSTQTRVLAVIQQITADPRDPFQVIRAKVPVNLQALKWVVVQ
jgi:cell shape-determining protein MreC